LWAHIKRISQRRSTELAACQECPGKAHCAGGCMGRAYAAHGDPMTVEDRCQLRKAVYGWKRPWGTSLGKSNPAERPERGQSSGSSSVVGTPPFGEQGNIS
jgi:hypothetical protein